MQASSGSRDTAMVILNLALGPRADLEDSGEEKNQLSYRYFWWYRKWGIGFKMTTLKLFGMSRCKHDALKTVGDWDFL